ncbi:type VII secretion system-associated protein [Streptomyces sp. NPDC001046]|uniref:type VII secretion system-associated protein n=1 Tax=Streptomyces sp. NPDC001046 TaxID=3364543 RepID=UPI0036C560AB
MRPGDRRAAPQGALPVTPDAPGPTAAASSVTGAGETVDTSETPEIPDAVRAAARRAPGHWVGVVDPEWTPERTPPDWAVVGEWRSDDSGDVAEYRANPAYRPSARMLGWPEPTDPVDAAAQRAATGYGSVAEALAALAAAEVTVARGPDGGPLTAAGQDGAPVVLLFTSAPHAFMSSALRHDTLPAGELARSLRGSGTMLLVNPGAAAPLLVPAGSVPGAGSGDEAGGVTPGSPPPAGTPAAEPAVASGSRSDGLPEPWPHTTGRTP